MSHIAVLPVTSSLYLADGVLGYPGGKTDIVGIFNRVNAQQYPHVQKHLVVYARLLQGLGQIAVNISIVNATNMGIIHQSPTQTLFFPHRDRTIELAMTFKGVRFPVSSVHLVQLWAEGQWLADTRLELG